MNGLTFRARIVGLVVLAALVIVLPYTTTRPLTWGLLPFVAIALVVVGFGWRVRLVVVPAFIVTASLAFLGADVHARDVVVLAGMMLVAWLLLSMLRAAVQRGIDAAVRERRSVERSRDLLTAMVDVVSLDPSLTVARVADALVALGFPLTNIGEVVGDRIQQIVIRGVPDGVPLISLSVGEGLAGAAAQMQEVIYVDDYRSSRFHSDKAPPVPIGAAMAMPIVLDGETAGVMFAARPTRGPISEQDRKYIEALGTQAARALDVARRYRAEQQIAERLAEFERLKVGFLGSVTADLRGPLSVIRGLAHTLEQNSQAMDLADAEHLLNRINDSVDRLDRMIESLLDFSRTRRSPGEGHAGVALVEIAERVVVAVQDAFPTHHVQLDTEGACLVDGDAALLEQAFTHLIDNACRHTPTGSDVTVRIEGHTGIVTVRVVDDGPGLPAPVAEAIRIGAVGELHGTLGFTLVSHILAAHQSRLELVDSGGAGTVIGFTLAAGETGLGRPHPAPVEEAAS